MYPRRGAGVFEDMGPDTGSLTASGIWHQDEEPGDNFYERYDKFFSPLDNTLGLFAPRELALLEYSDEPSSDNLSGFVDAGFPLTRAYNPDLAMVKAGPLHLDLLTLSGTVLYSDYDGEQQPAEDDGWLSVVQLGFRGVMQLTDNLYLSATGQVYYLPETGDVGFFFGGGQNSFIRLAYETVYRDWEITVYDEFRVYHRLADILDEVEHDEIDRAGRYRFGRFSDHRKTDYFDSDSIYSLNRIGITAFKELNAWWRVGLGFDHTDFWDTLDFEDHRSSDRFSARIDYNGQDWRFAPFLEYSLTGVDEFDTRFHTVYLGASGLISENLRARGKVGYLHAEGGAVDVDRFVGDASVTHYLGASTSHSLSGGITQSILDEGDNWLATYGRYTITQELGARTRLSLFTQYSDQENLDVAGNDRAGWSYGARFGMSPWEYTKFDFTISRDEWESKTFNDTYNLSRNVFRASMAQQLAPYLHARLMYQFEDYDSSAAGDFDEHLYMLTITHIF
jgi:hypothetical protein